MSRNRSRGPGNSGKARKFTAAAGIQGGQAYAWAPAIRSKVVLTKDQVKAIRRSKMAERAAEQRARPPRLLPTGFPWFVNRRTGRPHENLRQSPATRHGAQS
jgi:hypothetical protein